jgi:hypothetical protein
MLALAFLVEFARAQEPQDQNRPSKPGEGSGGQRRLVISTPHGEVPASRS